MSSARAPRPVPGRVQGAVDTEPRDERARGRELALLALCHLESYPAVEHVDALELLWRSPPRGDDERGGLFAGLVRDPPTHRRAQALLRELLPRLSELDEIITQTSARWRLSRMAQVDRNVLRLAAFELAHRARTPRGVVLSEAVRLARRYGSERSPGFVNGLAEALAQRLRTEPDTGPEPNAGPEPDARPEPDAGPEPDADPEEGHG